MSFYVYKYTDPTNMEPIYVGKGQGDRLDIHWKQRIYHLNDNNPFLRRLRKIHDAGKQPIIEKIWEQDRSFESDELAEEFALLVEQEAIEKYGRRDLGTGTLWNLTDGGEGTSGMKHSDEAKAKIAEASKGRKHRESSKQLIASKTSRIKSDAEKDKIRAARAKQPEPHLGHKHSDETRKLISDNVKKAHSEGRGIHKGYKQTTEHSARISE